MEKITRNVRDLKQDERRLYEAALGERLRDNQQVIVQVVTLHEPERRQETGPGATATAQLPAWCNVYDGLSDEEIAEIENVILDRSDWNRNTP